MNNPYRKTGVSPDPDDRLGQAPEGVDGVVETLDKGIKTLEGLEEQIEAAKKFRQERKWDPKDTDHMLVGGEVILLGDEGYTVCGDCSWLENPDPWEHWKPEHAEYLEVVVPRLSGTIGPISTDRLYYRRCYVCGKMTIQKVVHDSGTDRIAAKYFSVDLHWEKEKRRDENK